MRLRSERERGGWLVRLFGDAGEIGCGYEMRRGETPLRNFSRTEHGPKAWAWRLKGREEQGDRLGLFQRHAWREALKSELAAQ